MLRSIPAEICGATVCRVQIKWSLLQGREEEGGGVRAKAVARARAALGDDAMCRKRAPHCRAARPAASPTHMGFVWPPCTYNSHTPTPSLCYWTPTLPAPNSSTSSRRPLTHSSSKQSPFFLSVAVTPSPPPEQQPVKMEVTKGGVSMRGREKRASSEAAQQRQHLAGSGEAP